MKYINFSSEPLSEGDPVVAQIYPDNWVYAVIVGIDSVKFSDDKQYCVRTLDKKVIYRLTEDVRSIRYHKDYELIRLLQGKMDEETQAQKDVSNRIKELKESIKEESIKVSNISATIDQLQNTIENLTK